MKANAKLTRQTAFSRAFRGLHSQGFKRSMTRDDMGQEWCAYRGLKGRRCAIGWLITDEQASAAPWGMVTEYLGRVGPFKNLRPLRESFLSLLQATHDYSKTPREMRAALINFAAAYGLRVPGLRRARKSPSPA